MNEITRYRRHDYRAPQEYCFLANFARDGIDLASSLHNVKYRTLAGSALESFTTSCAFRLDSRFCIVFQFSQHDCRQ
jgi:hypothetical protein